MSNFNMGLICYTHVGAPMFSKGKLRLALRTTSKLDYQKIPQGIGISALPSKSLRPVYGCFHKVQFLHTFTFFSASRPTPCLMRDTKPLIAQAPLKTLGEQ